MLKAVQKHFNFLILVLLFIFCLVSCQTTNNIEGQDINPATMLNKDCDVYLMLPVKDQEDFLLNLLENYANISQKDASDLIKRFDTIYIGYYINTNNIQMIIKGKFPKPLVKVAFAKNKNYKKLNYKEQGISINIYNNEKNNMLISFPTSDLLCVASNKDIMSSLYLNAFLQQDFTLSWLEAQTSNIRFVIANPLNVFSGAMGQSVQMGVESLYGELESVQKDYSLSIYIYTSKIFVKPMLGLLRLTLIGQGVNIKQIDDTTIKISEILITKQQIFNYLSGVSTSE